MQGYRRYVVLYPACDARADLQRARAAANRYAAQARRTRSEARRAQLRRQIAGIAKWRIAPAQQRLRSV